MANSGWTNDAVDTLTVPTGAGSGARVVIANQANGDAVDVYNSSNVLVLSIDRFGDITSTDASTGDDIRIGQSLINFLTSGGDSGAIDFNAHSGTQGASLNLGASTNGVTSNGALTILAKGVGGGAQPATVVANERDFIGSVVVNSGPLSTNNLMFAGSYSGTTDAGGHLVFNHNALFTPHVVTITGTTSGGTFANLTYGVNAKTATQLDVNFTIANTGAPWANNLITFDAVMFG